MSHSGRALPARGLRLRRVCEASGWRAWRGAATLAPAELRPGRAYESSSRPRWRVWRGAATLALAGLALSGCETTAEKSAQLERAAKREQAAHPALTQQGLSIAHAGSSVKVLGATVVRGSEGAAAVVSVSNISTHTLRAVPIAITVKNTHGRTLYQNNAPGLEAALTSISSLPAHGSVTWVDDQIPSAGEPASVSAIVGEAPAASGPQPRIEVAGTRLGEETSGEVAGTVRNRSRLTQQKLVVYVIARRAGGIVAAGRAVLPEVTGDASVPFHAFLVGTPTGAKLQASAPASTFGG